MEEPERTTDRKADVFVSGMEACVLSSALVLRQKDRFVNVNEQVKAAGWMPGSTKNDLRKAPALL